MIPFRKLHGLGNDFIVIAALSWSTRQVDQLIERVPNLCDRHEGVGADGLLLIRPASAADARMRVINADGSEPETCGNGLRCVTKFLRDHVAELASRDELVIETSAGPVRCTIRPPSPAPVQQVRVDMGTAQHDAGFDDALSVARAKRSFRGTVINVGNPHLVLFHDDDGSDLRCRALEYGPLLERHQAFPDRINVGFARLLGGTDMELWVWERGCGLTRACGSGACAAAAAAVVTDRWTADTPLSVRLPGGSLNIEVTSELAVYMEGPAVEVFSGELPF